MSLFQNYLIELYHKKAPILKSLVLSFFNRNKGRMKLILGLFFFYLLILLINKTSKDLQGLGWMLLLGLITIILNIIVPFFKNKNLEIIPFVLNTGTSVLIYILFLPFSTRVFFSNSDNLAYKLFFPIFLAIFCIQFFYTFIKQSLKINFLSFLALLLATYLMTGAF